MFADHIEIMQEEKFILLYSALYRPQQPQWYAMSAIYSDSYNE